MRRALQLLVGGTLAIWLAVSYPAYRLGGEVSLATSVLAALLCLVPTSATLLWAGWAQDQSPQQQIITILGGTGLRMVIVLGFGLVLSSCYPAVVIGAFRELLGLLGNSAWAPDRVPTITTLWAWLLVFYLITLGLEVVILVARNPKAFSDAS